MATRTSSNNAGRSPLNRERVLRAAIRLADAHGLESLTMRRLGQELGVEAMSLYNHVANKDDLLEGIADTITAEFDVPSLEVDWRATLRQSAISAHEVLRRHPWASSLIESRPTIGPARMRYLDAVVGVLCGAGFSTLLTSQAIMALDSHTYGFTLQEQSWSFDLDDAAAVAASFARAIPEREYPHLHGMVALAASAPAEFPLDFAFGLDLILDGLERLRDATTAP
jgi:AcrR family transcriptional regulator